MPIRSTAAKQWFWQVTTLAWVVTLGLVGVLVAGFAGMGSCVYQKFASDSVPTTPPAPITTSVRTSDCGPTSNTPCTEREARLILQAEVDSFAKPTVKGDLKKLRKYERDLYATRADQVRAEIEADKAKWERMRYRELQQELKSSQPSPTSAPDISCDATPWTRSRCDRMSR